MDIEKKLPAYVLIDTGPLKKLTNVLHMQLNDMLYQVVSAVPKETVNLTDKILKEWQNKIAVEVEQNNALSASQYTKQLQTLNIERDQILIHFFSIIRSQCYSPDADMRAAAERVNVILGSYRGIQREGIESKSGHIKGLLEDIKKCTAELVKFGLNGTVNQLREKNEKFDQLDMQRSQDLSAENLPNASKARLETDDVFMLICQYIQGSYLFSKNDDDKRAIVHLVDGMNGIVYRNAVTETKTDGRRFVNLIPLSYATTNPLIHCVRGSTLSPERLPVRVHLAPTRRRMSIMKKRCFSASIKSAISICSRKRRSGNRDSADNFAF